MADNLEYICKECGFNWITLNGEHEICLKYHSKTIEYIREFRYWLNIKTQKKWEDVAVPLVEKDH